MNPIVIPAIFTAKDKMTQKMAAMSKSVSKFASDSMDKFNQAGKNAFSFGKRMAVTGAIIAAPFVLAGREAVKFEDRMSDVGKTTGLQGNELRKFGDDILQMSTKTRSSIDDLSTIAEIGGRLGITGSKNLKAFTSSANEFAVALGGDFSGGVESAITQFGKVTSLFRDTKDLDIAPALKKAGSAMNALSAKGVNVEGLTDFSLRVGALPEAFRPSLASASALGATLQKAGVDSQIASSGFSNFITTASANLPAFAKEMGITTAQAKQLIDTDTAGFFAQFASKMKGVPASELSLKLKGLKLNSLEVQKAVGAMSGSLDVYTELSRLSSDQLRKGTSITEEYNTKNNNTAGKLAQLRNQFKSIVITIGTALIPVVSSLVESVSPMIQSFGKWMQRNKGLVTTIAKIAVAVSAFSFALSGLSYIVGGLQKVFAIASIAVKAFNLLFLANPIGPFVLAIGAIGAAVYALTRDFSGLNHAQELNNEVTARALDKVADQRVEIIQLFNTLKKAKTGTEEYKNTLAKIDQMQPGITKKYMDQNGVIKDAIGLQKELTSTIMQRAMTEARAEIAKEKMKEALLKREGGASSDTFTQSVIRFFGGDVNQLKLLESAGLMADAQRLMEQNQQQEFEVANPEKARQEANINNQMNISFTGLPEGVTATANGQPINPSVNNKLKLSSTR